MEHYKTPSAVVAAAIWLSVVQVFCALWIRDGIRDAATDNGELATIAAKLDDLRGTNEVPRSYFQGQHQAEQDLFSGPGWRLEGGKRVPVPQKSQ